MIGLILTHTKSVAVGSNTCGMGYLATKNQKLYNSHILLNIKIYIMEEPIIGKELADFLYEIFSDGYEDFNDKE